MEENTGIKAIIYLQAMAGIVEPESSARLGWNEMSRAEKERTMQVYDMLNIEEHCVATMTLDGEMVVRDTREDNG